MSKKYLVNEDDLISIGDAIRAKTGKSDLLTLDQMPLEIEGIMDGQPIEVDSLDNALLVSENAGKVYKCEDKLYQVNKVTSLKGLTIKFNKHITPCPVIGEDDEFECSAFTPSADELWYYDKLAFTGIRKEPFYTCTSGTSFISFVSLDYFVGAHYLSLDNQEETGWYYSDMNGNVVMLDKDFVITCFDCPALNENPEFIEWVFANARVHSKIETFNDIKAFRPNYSAFYDLDYFFWTCLDAVRVKTEDYSARNWNVSGQYIASFKINGEVITKAFSHIAIPYDSSNPITFSNNSEDLLVFSYSWNTEEFAIKYNDIILDEAPIFTTFDCMFNDSDGFLQYVLTTSELIDMGYINGCSFAEYMEEEEPEFNIAYGDTEPTDTSKLWIKTADPKVMKVTPNFVYRNGNIESGVATLPTAALDIETATVGTAIYLFEGHSNAVYVFDTLTNTLTRLSTTLPTAAYGIGVASVGTKVYLFGGEVGGDDDSGSYIFLDTINVFDTITHTITTLDTKLPEASAGIAVAAVGTKVYLLGGATNGTSSYTSICVFDTLTNTITTLDAKLPYHLAGWKSVAIGTKVYLLVGVELIVLDTLTNTITTDTSIFLGNAASSVPAVVGTSIYYFGGRYSSNGNSANLIRVFDTTNNAFITVSTATLPTAAYGIGVASVGTKVYLFGGYEQGSGELDTINVFTAFPSLAHNNLVIEPSNTKNQFNLLPNVEMGVNAVYLGNEEGIGEKVSAALYKDGAWVEI